MLYHMWENLEAENFDKNLPTNSYYKCSVDNAPAFLLYNSTIRFQSTACPLHYNCKNIYYMQNNGHIPIVFLELSNFS